MADADNTQGAGGTGEGAGSGTGRDDAAFYQAEAKKAFKARDDAKAELRRAQEAGLLITEERLAKVQELETAATKADAGMVRIHAHTIRSITPSLSLRGFLA